MKISNLLEERNVHPALEADRKEDAIRQVIQSLADDIGEGMIEKACRAVLEREGVMSTGVGKGLAIPHGKVAGLEGSFVAFARLTNPIEYGSIDGKPVNMIFLLIGPESQSSLHIKLLSRISRLMNNEHFRLQLMECDSASSIINQFVAEETQYP